MNNEIQIITQQLKDAYDGSAWFGRSVKNIFSEIDVNTALQKTNEQHSILELLYHMIIWREFTISRLQPVPDKDIHYFEKNDWQQLDQSQEKLLSILSRLDNSILEETVEDRKYNFRFLLYGIIQHDIYHLGQVAYIKKMIEAEKTNSV